VATNILKQATVEKAIARIALQEMGQPLLEPLSPRECEVLHLLGTGCSNAEIACQLVIAVATVKVHTRRIYSKLHVSNRIQAILQAQHLHLL
jgi:LuxR family maltose regulon positive regulatory protein